MAADNGYYDEGVFCRAERTRTMRSLRIFGRGWKERIAHIPGVQSAALAYGLPPLRSPNMNDTEIEGFVKREGGPN